MYTKVEAVRFMRTAIRTVNVQAVYSGLIWRMVLEQRCSSFGHGQLAPFWYHSAQKERKNMVCKF